METTGIISIIVAVISAIATITSVIISNNKHSADTDAKLDKALAVQETKLDELTREVREHNNFAIRIPQIEAKLNGLERRVDRMEDK